jgi:truncated hemoglobin YjbI
MVYLRQSRKLAYEIGLHRIALVVDAAHRQMKTHPSFAKQFYVNGSDGEQRAHLTYFWWVILGGNKLKEVDWQVVREGASTGINTESLSDWLAVFRQAAFPIIGEELAHAWVLRAEQVANKFLIVDQTDADKLAKAS